MSKISLDTARKLKYLYQDGHEVDFIQSFMKIVDKDTKIVPFILTSEQKEFAESLEKNNIVLKSRQLGLSSVTIGLSLRQSIVHPNSSCLLVSHDQKSCNAIFDKLKQQYNLLPDWIKPNELANNRQELKFTNGSRITCVCAGNKDLGRGDTLHLVHLSEFAFWKNPDKQLNSITQALAPDGKLIIETTAQGLNYFSELWTQSKNLENDFKPFFFNWIGGSTLFKKDYIQAVERYKARNNGKMLTVDELDTEELTLMELGASMEQLTWRRLKISTIGIEQFRQEFPSTDIEAFITSSNNVFDAERLTEIERAIINEKINPISLNNIVDLPMSLKMLSKSFFIYHLPETGKRYYLGCDTADGVGTDYSVIEVFDAEGKQCAEFYNNKIQPHEFAEIIREVGLFYNEGLLVVETNKSGNTVVYKLWKEFAYRNMYKYKKYNERNKMVYARGFDTNATSKPMIINNFRELFSKKQLQLNSRRLLQEMKIFNADYKAEGRGHDDTVIATALAVEGVKYPYWYV